MCFLMLYILKKKIGIFRDKNGDGKTHFANLFLLDFNQETSVFNMRDGGGGFSGKCCWDVG